MTERETNIWQTKLAARLHDPAEKALVLLRDPSGHENGTSRALTRLLGFHEIGIDSVDGDNDEALVRTLFKKGIPAAMYRDVQHADWWAAAADRPQWPMQEITVTTTKGEEKTFMVAPWAQVRWANKPVLIHPLTGQQYDLGKHGGLKDTDFHNIKQRSFDHHGKLMAALDRADPSQPQDWKKTLLTLWRFAPELGETVDNDTLGELWKLLPADTRVPDHSIWDHLDLVSAFAGAFAADPQGEVALLTLSIGPVQPFIASARKMDDLWAGSHLLARLSWEAMRVVADELGPDAILFPRLRGVPQVDLWLRDQCGLPAELFKDCEWNRGSTDSNPLFSAALPNRFVAVVPADRARQLAHAVQVQVRAWLQEQGVAVLARLFAAAEIPDDPSLHCHRQMREQLDGFPEVHWAIVPFSLIGVANNDKQTGLDTQQLSSAMRPFFETAAGTGPGAACGFLDSPAWKLLQTEIPLLDADGAKVGFFAPNPGVLYPAVHELAERALAATKSLRPFAQTAQQGWRCTLGGDVEWLTTDAQQLVLPAGQRRSNRDPGFDANRHQETLWTRVADSRPAWAKQGEHLGALAAIKRLWPTLFAEETARALNKAGQDPATADGARTVVDRFVVSTHTMALAHQLDQWLANGARRKAELDELCSKHAKSIDAVALPRKLMRHYGRSDRNVLPLVAKIPALLELASDAEMDEREAHRIRQAVRKILGGAGDAQPDAQLETYYGLLLMDGDRMGVWLSGGAGHSQGGARSGASDFAITYRDSFHPQVQAGFDQRAARQPQLQRYGKQPRALSPGRQLAISGALNDFSLSVVRHVVELEHLGRLIYAGGDDVFAMLPVADLLPAMQRLRHAYSGHDPAHAGGRDPRGLTLHQGFAILNHKLMRMMGTQATASCGAVIAHHQAPLAAVRRELHAAEQRAKNEGGRDAFSITIIKRSGGALRLTAKWGEPVALLDDLREFLACDGVSRRAAYHTLQWLDAQSLPTPQGDGAMLASLLGYQLERQSGGKLQAAGRQGDGKPDAAGARADDAKALAAPLAQRLVQQTMQQPGDKRIAWLRNFISVAEFLAREVRTSAQTR